MGQAVGEAATRLGLEVVPYTLCSAGDAAKQTEVIVGGKAIKLVPPGAILVHIVF